MFCIHVASHTGGCCDEGATSRQAALQLSLASMLGNSHSSTRLLQPIRYKCTFSSSYHWCADAWAFCCEQEPVNGPDVIMPHLCECIFSGFSLSPMFWLAGTYFAADANYCIASRFAKPRKQAALQRQRMDQSPQDPSQCPQRRPAFLPDEQAVLLCHVLLGKVNDKVIVGSKSLSQPPTGFDSVRRCGRGGCEPKNPIFALFDNAQSYPAYIIHYDHQP